MTKKKIIGKPYANYSTQFLVKVFNEGPNRVANAIEGLNDKDFKSIVIPNKWSIAEILCHLTDSEILASCRFRQAFCNHNGDFPNYDQDQWATFLRYQFRNREEIQDCLDLFRLLRKTTGTLISTFEKTDWEKTGYHPERGFMTLRELLELYSDHSERHIEQILERRILLGKPKDMDILLKERLY